MPKVIINAQLTLEGVDAEELIKDYKKCSTSKRSAAMEEIKEELEDYTEMTVSHFEFLIEE